MPSKDVYGREWEFSQPTTPDPRRSQYRAVTGQLFNEDGVHPGGAYGALLDPNSDASKSYSFMGGRDGLAANQYRGMGALQREAVRADTIADGALRAQQMGLAGAYMDRFEGRGPSLAGFAQQRGMDQAGAQMAAGRVGAGAGAQRLAMLRGGAAGAAAAQGGAQMRSDETFAAGQGYAGLTGSMRGGDATMAMKQANLNLRQRSLDDTERSQYEDLAQGVDALGMQGRTARANAIRGVHEIGLRRYENEARVAAERDARNQATGMGIISAAASAFPVVGSAVSGLGAASR
jgi:hypothetical protein